MLARGPAEEEAAPATCRGPPKLLFFVLRPVVSSRRLLRCSEFDSERALVARPRDAPGLAAEAAAGTGVMLVASREPWNWSVKSLIERRYSIYGFWSILIGCLMLDVYKYDKFASQIAYLRNLPVLTTKGLGFGQLGV